MHLPKIKRAHSNNGRNYLTKIFQPIIPVQKESNTVKHEITSKSQRLMLELGIIHQANPGSFHLLPLGLRSLNKLINIIDEELHKIGCGKIIMPTLANKNLWKTTGRLESAQSELFQLKDRHNMDYLLCPTHEESITALISSLSPVSYKEFPLRLYQITNKFRDEMKPRFGLMRAREFLMKDLYTFDLDLETAKDTYDDVNECYSSIFKRIGLDYLKVLGTSGNIGGSISHEYHYIADIGEDKILSCNDCGYSANIELSGEEGCPRCKRNSVEKSLGIEIAHTFLLGDKYSKPLNATYLNSSGKPVTLQMGCYGIGVSRLLAAALEVLSKDQELRWPDSIAPFNAIILPPKDGSKEENTTKDFADKLYSSLEELENFKNNVLIDDRTFQTIGRRFLDARRVGYRFIIVIGKKATESEPLFELNDLQNNTQIFLNHNELISYVNENIDF